MINYNIYQLKAPPIEALQFCRSFDNFVNQYSRYSKLLHTKLLSPIMIHILK